MDNNKSGPGELKDHGNNAADLESVRVIHNVRPVRRGVGGLLLLVVLVVGLIGAGYYYFFHMGTPDRFSPLQAEKGNLLAAAWSFEPGRESDETVAEVWDLRGDSEKGFALVKKDARSGRFAIQAAMPETGVVHAVYIPVLKLHPRRQYTASAWVKIMGGAMVSLKAAYSSQRDRDDVQGDLRTAQSDELYTEEFVSAREQSGEYIKISGTVFPPPEADALRFSIVAAGQGEVVVDDVSLFEATASARDQLGTSGAIDFFPSGGGYLVKRIDHTLFLGGRIAATESIAGEGGVTLVHDTETEGFNPEGEQYLYAGERAGLLRVTRQLEVNAGQIRGSFTMAPTAESALGEIRYCFDLLAPYARYGIGVLTGNEFSLYETSFPQIEADALILGGESDRIKIVFDHPLPVLGAERKDGGVRVQCLFAAGREIKCDYQILSDFTEESKEAHALLQQASKAQQAKNYGEALTRIEQVLLRYPYNLSVVERAETLRDSILTVKRQLLSEIQEQLRSAEFLNTPELFSELESDCRRAIRRFPVDRDFQEALKVVQEKGSALLSRSEDQRAERLFLLARNLDEAGDRDRTLAQIVRAMQEDYPDSEWTELAINLIKPAGSGEEQKE